MVKSSNRRNKTKRSWRGNSAVQKAKQRAERSERWKQRRAAWRQVWNLRYKLPFAVGVASIALVALAFVVTPKLPKAYLFWLKLAAFLITAILGVLGIFTDFKDTNKKVTRTGWLNAAGLGLALIVGVMAQYIENDKTVKTEKEQQQRSEDEKTALKDLNAKNQMVLENVASLLKKNNDILNVTQGTLHQVGRNLETIGDTVVVRYRIEFISKDQDFKEAEKTLNEMIMALPKTGPLSSFEDSHTWVTPLFNPKGTFTAYFDKHSSLMPNKLGVDSSLKTVPFTIIFYKSWPKVSPSKAAACYDLFHAGVEYNWNEALTASLPPDRNLEIRLDPPELKYDTARGDNIIEQFSESGSVFKRVPSSGAMLSAQDFGGAYVRMLPFPYANIRFTNVSIQVGQRFFKVPVDKLVPDVCHGMRYRLPKT